MVHSIYRYFTEMSLFGILSKQTDTLKTSSLKKNYEHQVTFLMVSYNNDNIINVK